MFTDILPVLALLGALCLVPLFLLQAVERREDYCGKIKPCFWCDKDCSFHRLVKITN